MTTYLLAIDFNKDNGAPRPGAGEMKLSSRVSRWDQMLLFAQTPIPSKQRVRWRPLHFFVSCSFARRAVLRKNSCRKHLLRAKWRTGNRRIGALVLTKGIAFWVDFEDMHAIVKTLLWWCGVYYFPCFLEVPFFATTGTFDCRSCFCPTLPAFCPSLATCRPSKQPGISYRLLSLSALLQYYCSTRHTSISGTLIALSYSFICSAFPPDVTKIVYLMI